jgi:hypothetical protein
VLFDVGHGGGSFSWGVAVPHVKEGFLPDTISTDIHIGSMNAGMKDQLNVMSKFLALGLKLEDVIARATWNSARSIKREELGNLSVGAPADVTVPEPPDGPLRLRRLLRRAAQGRQEARLPDDAARRQGRLRSRRTGASRLGDAAEGYRSTGDPRWDAYSRGKNGEDQSQEVRARRRGGAGDGCRSEAGARPRRQAGQEGPLAGRQEAGEDAAVQRRHVLRGLVFIAGVGAHFEGDIKAHTKHVLDEVQKKLEGSAPRWRRS